jgi:phosphoribulokinase
MPRKYPIIAVTGSSDAGTTAVRITFEGIFEHERVNAALIDDALQSRPDTIVVPGPKMEFVMQLIVTPLLQDLVGESRKARELKI